MNISKPRTETEKKLAKIWEAVLKLESVGINDNFFEIGGDSVKAMEILSRAKKEVGSISMNKFQTIGEVASYIDSLENQKVSEIKHEESKEDMKDIMDMLDL